MEFEQTRTWAECSESAFLGNIRTVRQMLKNTKLLGVVKANAYGHGAVRAARLLGSEGAAGLAVSTLPEAVELREAGIKLPVLVLGPTEPLFFDELVSHDLTQTVADPGFAERYSQAAVKSGRSLKCHLKLDTGMGRLGFTEPAEALKAV
ncbi:MAG: alanine racemase, partial [Clostridiales bacterium]|nr:alanine racemase [Clostridiales bacterium]